MGTQQACDLLGNLPLSCTMGCAIKSPPGGLRGQREEEGQLCWVCRWVEDGSEDIFHPGFQRPQLLALGPTGGCPSLWVASFFLLSPGLPHPSAPSASGLEEGILWVF